MTLHQLEYVVGVATYGSFKYAAQKLSVSQPALSIQIQKLEEEIGIRIFDRTRNPIKPTGDGKLFIERAQEVLTSAKRLSDFSTGLSNSLSGKLNVGIIPTLAPFLVPLFTETLQNRYQNFSLDIHETITEKVVKGVRSGGLDAGLISTPIEAYGIVSFPLFYEKFYLYSTENQLSEKFEVDLSEINYNKLWLLEEGNCFRDQINNFCDLKKIRKNKTFVYRSNSIDALIRMVDTKGGTTILPELSTLSLSESQEENIKGITGTPKAREIAMIVTKHNDKHRFVEKLMESIRESIPKGMLSKKGIEVVDPEIRLD